jgi:nuclear pore complex protein Nup54
LFGGGGLFGNTTTNTNNSQQQQPAGGLFASSNTQQQQPTGGLFGSTNTQQVTGGLFGQPQQQKPSLFGSTNTNPLTTSALNPPAITTSNNKSGGLFGSAMSTTNNLTSTARGPGNEADAQTQFAVLTKRIEGVVAAWNSQDPQCRFQVRFLFH